LLVESDRVEMIEMLADQNPLVATPDPTLRRPDERVATYERAL
jgi:hypothetical protein